MAEFAIRLHAQFRGFEDYRRGLSLCDNPYASDPLARIWDDAWLRQWRAFGCRGLTLLPETQRLRLVALGFKVRG
jgi:hypothetical protein